MVRKVIPIYEFPEKIGAVISGPHQCDPLQSGLLHAPTSAVLCSNLLPNPPEIETGSLPGKLSMSRLRRLGLERQKSGVRMKSIWSPLCAPGFVLSAFCSPPGSSCPSKSRRVSEERDSAPPATGSAGQRGCCLSTLPLPPRRACARRRSYRRSAGGRFRSASTPWSRSHALGSWR